jgi:hypothetical protein
MVNMNLLHEYAEKKLEKRRLEGEVNKITKWLNEQEETLLEQFGEEGIQNIKLDGLGTAYVASQLWAGPWQDDDGIAQNQLTCDALKAAGLGIFVAEAFNRNTVSSWVREQPKNDLGDPILPEELRDKLRVARVFYLRVLKD